MSSAPSEIVDLIERFGHNADYYRGPSYNETQVRGEFLDPFFAALGWDVANRDGVAPAYQSVILQATLRTPGSNTTMPDYCFRVGPERKFFVEAKKPSVDIASAVQPAYQLRRYAWTAKLPLSILTDFEQLSVYDCRTKPIPNDSPAAARLLLVHYAEYAERWDEIAAIFSRDAVWRGDYDRYAQAAKGKRGTQEVDDAFLAEIEEWRALLARNLALRNPLLTVRGLNYAVQQTIDRLIFLRICEDRGIEPYEQLKNALTGAGVYARLVELFRRADARYNSGLFHLRAEKGREHPDLLTPDLHVDDKALAEIIHSLYYPHCPYAFDVLSADILGNVYERFLGSVIRLTAGHQAKVEQKPEVRKAGGVYYTPKYVVDYIVQHTVGQLCAGKTPGEISKLRILDPACGSGSFLLGAYQYLLDYHLNWYVEHPTKQARREVYQGRGGQWFLTTEEKKRVLLNNLYGVDIDPQAVEVTKLSLLLKVLEGESQETIAAQMALWQERALPDLADNIKCGNSLIGPDFYEGRQLGLLDEEETYRVNAFDWDQEFAEIMRGGGFDAVIGNPPWISAWTGEEQVRGYLSRRDSRLTGHWDLYLAFLLSTLDLIKPDGKHSFVYPTSILTEAYAKSVREALIREGYLRFIAVFGTDRVFGKVSRKVCILVLSRESSLAGTQVHRWLSGGIAETISVDPLTWLANHNAMISIDVSGKMTPVRNKVEARSIRVGDAYYVNYGAQLSSKEKGRFTQDRLLGETPTGNPKKCLRGNSVRRYVLDWGGLYLDYRPEIMYGPRHPSFFEAPKIIVNKTSSKGYGLMATFDRSGYYCDQRLVCLVHYDYLEGSPLKLQYKGFKRAPRAESELFDLGILNSRLLTSWFAGFVATKNLQGEYTDVLPKMVRNLPIRAIDFSDPADVARHDQMVALVEQMLELHRRLAAAEMPQEREMLERQIAATDREIDRLVYALYGLTEQEIAIIEA